MGAWLIIVLTLCLRLTPCGLAADGAAGQVDNTAVNLVLDNLLLIDKYASNPKALSGVFRTLAMDRALWLQGPANDPEQLVQINIKRLELRDQAISGYIGSDGLKFLLRYNFLGDLLMDKIHNHIALTTVNRKKLEDHYFTALSKARRRAMAERQTTERAPDHRLITSMIEKLDLEFAGLLTPDGLGQSEVVVHEFFGQMSKIVTSHSAVINQLLAESRAAYLEGISRRSEMPKPINR